MEDDELVAVQLAPSSTDGSVAVTYVAQGTPIDFASIGGAVEAGGGSGLGIGAILGGIALAGGGLALAAGGGGDDAEQPQPPAPPPVPDTTAPSGATGMTINPTGTQITGSAEAGATVRIDTNGDGQADVTTVVGADGGFTAPLSPALTNGQTVSVTVSDPAGNTSPAVTINAPDSTAPQPASDVAITADGSGLSGKAEPGSTVGVDTSGDGRPDQTAVTRPDGTFQIGLTPPLIKGEPVAVIVTDPAGNNSAPVNVTAPDLSPAPPAPVIGPSNGKVIEGTAEPGSMVTLSAGGVVLGSAIVGSDGTWSFTPATPLADGVIVSGVAANAQGENGPAATITIDGAAPGLPVIEPSNGTVLEGTAEANSVVTLSDRQGNPIGQAAVDASGNWSFRPAAPLANGAVVQAMATDAVGNTGPAIAITIDALAPSAPVIAPSNGVAFSGVAEAGSTVTITGGGGAVLGTALADANGNWSFTPAQPVADGTNVSASAKDAAGNVGPAASIVVDAVAPPAPIISPTNGNTIVGTAEANSLVTLSSGGAVLGTTRADAIGNWSFEPAAPLTNGAVVGATATDAAGNVGAVGTIGVDSSLPSVPVIDPSNGATISGSADAGNTVTLTDGNGVLIAQLVADPSGNWSFNPAAPLLDGTVIQAVAQNGMGVDSAPAFEIVDGIAPAAPVVDPSSGSELSGVAEAGATITLVSGGVAIGTATADANGAWSVTLSPSLGDGVTVSVTATDAAGNTGSPATAVIDASAPAAPVLEASNGVFLSGEAEPGSIVTLSAGGTVLGTATADVNGDWVFTPTPPLGNGAVVTATAADAAGNVSAPSSTTIDTVAPLAPTLDATNGTVLSGMAEANSIITLTDGGGAAIGMTVADANGNWSFSPAQPLGNGTVVAATATDAAGNTGPSGTATVDSIAPAAPTIDISNGTLLTGTADAGVAISLMDGAVTIGTTVADGAGNWSFTPTPDLVDGTVVSATAIDAAGNISAAATVTVDAQAPIAPVIAPSDGVSVTGTAEAGATITLEAGGTQIGTTTADGNGNWTVTPSTPLPDGTALVATATDGAGNVSPAANGLVDALAPLAPTVNPSNGIIFSGTAEAGSTVTLTDGVTPLGQAVADPAGNWSFIPTTPVGDAVVVTVSASDAAGNVGPAATVTVDAAAPAAPVLAPSNGVTITGTAEANATIDLTDGSGDPIGQTTADGSGNWTFTPGTALANGTIVLATATDVAGNVGSQAAVIVDSIAPAAPSVVPSNGALLSGTAEAGTDITITVGGTTLGTVTADGSGNWTFAPVTPLADGTAVGITATDASGNVSPTAGIFVDAIAPGAPVIAPTNGTNLVGTAEAFSTVSVSSGGTPIGTAVADVNGNWLLTPASPLPDTSTVNATATDAAGNVSGPGSATVDASLPSVPVIAPSNGVLISGTADANNIVTLTDGNGVLIGVAPVDGAGNWSFTPLVPLSDGTEVQATAENLFGTDSAAAAITIDGVAPAAPILDATNGVAISGTAEAGATITLTDGGGGAIGTTVADGTGNWSFTPGAPLGNATVVNAIATDAAGNASAQGTVTVDALAPGLPVIDPSNGVLLTGTAEANSTVTLADGNGNVLGQVAVDGSGNWALAPSPSLANGVTVNASATDAAGNTGPLASTIIDSVPPLAPANLLVSADGSGLAGTAEANSQVRIIVDGDTANPVFATADGTGAFTATFAPPLVLGQTLLVTAVDAANNVSPPAYTEAPDLAAPSLIIAEAADGYINAAEVGNGIQVAVGLTAGADVGDVITVEFVGQNGYVANQAHVITAAERVSGTAAITLMPPAGMAAYPQGASSVTASVNGSTASNAVNFVVDTVRPPTPVLSLVGNLLTISGEPGSELTVDVNLEGVVATAMVTADNSGLASLNLLTDLDIDPTWDQLLTASVSVRGEDPAGNQSNVATLGIGGAVGDQIVTVGNFGLDVALLPPTLGFSGRTESGSTVSVEIVTPAVTVVVAPPVDANGNFAVNLLSPAVLSQLGLSLTGLLNLGAGLSFNVVSTDSEGNESARYGVNLLGSGLGFNVGQISINGDAGVDLLSGTDGRAEVINALDGDDLILHVGSGDVVNAGSGNDTIELSATNFASVDGGAGFDTILFDNGIDIDYNGPGIGTWTNIERIDLGTGDSGSVLTLTSAEVDAVTDSNNILQITGEADDQLVVTGAVDTGTDQTIGGFIYDVYTFGNTTLYVEENTVAVVV